MAYVELKHGDIFDGPADLIVLPCSTGGTITPLVQRKLVNYRIPYSKSRMKLGELSVVPFEGGENIAQYVAFAASVGGSGSTKHAIKRIGASLGAATIEWPTIRRVAAPLLGTGAGGLDEELVVSTLAAAFKTAAHPEASLVIHVLNKSEFESLVENQQPRHRDDERQSQVGRQSIRVFISYSHTSRKHEERVERLAAFLRNNGVDARLDVWHLRHGMDLPQFMTNELMLASRVLIISDERYAENADGRVGGIGWETMIIQGDIAMRPQEFAKYLVIVTSDSVEAGLPHYLRTKYVIHWPSASCDDKHKRKLLLMELRDIVKIRRSGRTPFLCELTELLSTICSNPGGLYSRVVTTTVAREITRRRRGVVVRDPLDKIRRQGNQQEIAHRDLLYEQCSAHSRARHYAHENSGIIDTVNGLALSVYDLEMQL